MKRRATMMMVAVALGWTAQEAAAEHEPATRKSPRILEPSFAQSQPRHLREHMQAHPELFRPPARSSNRIVAVPVLVPIYSSPYPNNGAPPAPGYVPGATPYWYFCPDSQRYYPDVSVCASGWLAFVSGTAGPAY